MENKKKIYIIDYGVGNIGSLTNMIKYIGEDVDVSNKIDDLKNADAMILPGVGSFDEAVKKIRSIDGLHELILDKALNQKIPFLGICLGMQLLLDSSEEGTLKGLGLINGKAFKFQKNKNFKIPHMGWNYINILKKNDLIQENEYLKFYFVHSYYVMVEDAKNVIGKTQYINEFDSIIQYKNIFGIQFHPERSHKNGMKLLKNFYNIVNVS